MLEHEPREGNILEQLSSHKFEVINYFSTVVNLPFRSPMLLPFGEVLSRPSSLLVLNVNIDGQVFSGGGEGATLSAPLYTDDYGDVISELVGELVQGMTVKPFSFKESVEYIHRYVFTNEKRYPTARMTVEMAIIDALAKSSDQNVASMLGLRGKLLEVPFGKSISGRTEEETLIEVDNAVSMNAKKIKLKISPSTANEVLDALGKIRRRYPDIELMVDANGSFDSSDTKQLEILRILDAQGLVMIEEPVSRVGNTKGLDAVRALREKIPVFETSICLDDCLVDNNTTMQALDENLCDVINIKPGRIGSIVSAIDLAYICKSRGKQIMVGGMFEATPGRIMTTTLAGFFNSLGFKIPGDLSLAQDRLSEDIVPKEQQLKIGPNGGILLPTGIGWGFSIDERYGVIS